MTFSFALMGAEPALALCPAWNCANGYAVGAKASYGGLDYTLTAGARGANTMCPYPPNTDNWWSQTGSCSGSTPTATATSRPAATPTATSGARATATATSRPRATATSGGSGISSIVTSAHFDAIWAPGNPRNANYVYADFVSGAANYTSMCGTGDTNTKKRECAAYFANKSQETSEGRYDRELFCQPGGGGYGTAGCNYCVSASGCGNCPTNGTQFWGRGPIQLSHNYNYCSAQSGTGVNTLHSDPNSMFNNRVNMWKVANWYWMTQPGPARSGWPNENAHDAITTTDASGNYGFGATIRAINGALECIQNDARQLNRIKYYTGQGQDNDDGNGGALQVLGYAGGNFGRRTCF